MPDPTDDDVVVQGTSGGPPLSVSPSMLGHAGIEPAEMAGREAAAHMARQEAAHDTVGSTLKAALGGAAKTLTGGLWKPFSVDAEFNPWASGIGQLLGYGPAMFMGTGEASAAEEGGLGLADLLGGAPSLATKASRYAEGLLPETIAGSKALGNVARTAGGGAAFGVTDEATHQLLDSDKQFSGENLLSAGAYGGLLGVAGSAFSEGVGKLGEVRGRIGDLLKRDASAVDEAAMRSEFPTSGLGREPSTFSLENYPDGTKALDAIDDHLKDVTKVNDLARELHGEPAILQAHGIGQSELGDLIKPSYDAEQGLRDLKSGAEVPQSLAKKLAATDELAQKLSQVTDEVPGRFTDPATRQAFWKNVRDVAPDATPAEVATQRIWSHLTAPMDAASQAAARPGIVGQLGQAMLQKTPLRFLGGMSGQSMAVGGIMAAQHLLSHGAGSLLGAGLTGGLGMMAARGTSRLLQAAFRNPEIGGILAGSTEQVLRRSNVLPGTGVADTQDPRRTLRDFADRTRMVTPQQAAMHAVSSLGTLTGHAPNSVAAAGQVAAARQQYILGQLDQVDPRPTTPAAMLNRSLPTAANAHRMADVMRGVSSPVNVVVAALTGHLTSTMLQAAEAVFPATVNRLRTELLRGLGNMADPSGIAPRNRKAVETLLGPSLGGQPGSEFYQSTMQASADRAHKMTAGSGGAPKGPSPQPTPMAPAMQIAHPGEHTK